MANWRSISRALGSTTGQVPDEPLTVKVSDLPPPASSPNFVATCELWNGRERVGTWQIWRAGARLWRDVPVARSSLTRGTLLKDADVMMERRDILLLRDYF